jgi:hypothetical protein
MDPVPDPLILRKSGSAGNRTRVLWVCSQELWPLDHRYTHTHTHTRGIQSKCLILLNHRLSRNLLTTGVQHSHFFPQNLTNAERTKYKHYFLLTSIKLPKNNVVNLCAICHFCGYESFPFVILYGLEEKEFLFLCLSRYQTDMFCECL